MCCILLYFDILWKKQPVEDVKRLPFSVISNLVSSHFVFWMIWNLCFGVCKVPIFNNWIFLVTKWLSFCFFSLIVQPERPIAVSINTINTLYISHKMFIYSAIKEHNNYYSRMYGNHHYPKTLSHAFNLGWIFELM